jgi:hypothetical protein
LKSTGSVFRCFPHANSGNCGTIGSAFDLNDYATISNFVLRGPQANGNIDGAFNITAPRIAVTGSALPSNGLYLAAANNPSISANAGLVASFLRTNNAFMGLNAANPVNANDMLSAAGSNAGIRSITFQNVDAGTTSQEIIYLANSTGTTQASIRLNGGGFSGGQGANALQITNASTAPLVLGTGTEVIKFGTSGAFTANGTGTVTISNLMPNGHTATIAKWLTLTDSGGTVSFVPVFQ